MERSRERRWTRFLYPEFSLRAFLKLGLVAAVGALLGGIYGVIHDQITFSISEEYFSRNKFLQFHYADPGEDRPRLFAGLIGFLATWWVGAMVAWVLARISLKREGSIAPAKRLAKAFGLVFFVSILTAICGWGYGFWRKGTGYPEGWTDWMNSLGVLDQDAFMTVGYIHNASYLGGCLGMICGIVFLKRSRVGAGSGASS